MDSVIEIVKKAKLKYDASTSCYTVVKGLLTRANADTTDLQVKNAGWTNIQDTGSF